MESFLNKQKSKLEKAARTALSGAVILGAVAVTEQKSAEAAPLQTSHEQVESFNFNKEATAFLDQIVSLDIGIDDARGWHTLQAVIEEKFNTFALSCEKRQPYFSVKESEDMAGTVSLDAREATRKYLATKLLTYPNSNSLSIIVLKKILGSPNTIKTVPLVPNTESGTVQQSEIRRIHNDNW